MTRPATLTRSRMLLLAIAVGLACTASECVGTVSVGMAVPGPYYGPYGGGSFYVGTTVPIGW